MGHCSLCLEPLALSSPMYPITLPSVEITVKRLFFSSMMIAVPRKAAGHEKIQQPDPQGNSTAPTPDLIGGCPYYLTAFHVYRVKNLTSGTFWGGVMCTNSARFIPPKRCGVATRLRHNYPNAAIICCNAVLGQTLQPQLAAGQQTVSGEGNPT